jgi:hypothetical protein
MQQILDELTEFFTGNSKAPANPDPEHNVMLLQEARKKIETGIFTKLLKRPTVYILEILIYIVTILLFIIAFLVWGRIDNLFDSYDLLNLASENVANKQLPLAEYVWVSYVILAVMLLPSFICFLLGRLFTKSRKRTAIFIQVENMIDRVIYNLKG